MNAVKKVTNTSTHYRVERKDKAGRWTPVQNFCLVNFSLTLKGMKRNVDLYNRYRRRNLFKSPPALPTPRRYVKVTTHTTKLISKEMVK